MLQSGNVENPWLSAMSSHFAYWASPDVALFLLRALNHHDVRLGPPKESPTPIPPTANPPPSGEGITSPKGVFSPKGALSPKGILSPAAPSSPLSPAHGRDPAGSSFEQTAMGGQGPKEILRKGSRESLLRGLSDPEDWW